MLGCSFDHVPEERYELAKLVITCRRILSGVESRRYGRLWDSCECIQVMPHRNVIVLNTVVFEIASVDSYALGDVDRQVGCLMLLPDRGRASGLVPGVAGEDV